MPGARRLRQHLSRATQRSIYVRADILQPNRIDEPAFEEHLHRLRLHPAKDHSRPATVKLLADQIEDAQTGRVDHGDIAHPENHHRRRRARALERRFQFLGNAEKERTFEAINQDARRNILSPHRLSADLEITLRGDQMDLRDRLHLPNEKRRCDQQPQTYGDR